MEVNTREDAMTLLIGGLWDVFKEKMMHSTVPVIAGSTTERRVLGQGSATFLQTTEATFGVTAAHVVDGLQNAILGASGKIYLNDEVFTEFNIIDKNDALDLATFEVSSKMMNRKHALSRSKDFIPVSGAPILISGFPSSSNGEDEKHMIYGLFHAMGLVLSADERRVNFQVQRDEDIGAIFGSTLPFATDLGGISGGPITAFVCQNGLWSFNLCGVVKEAHQNLEYIVGSRTDYIDESGKINAPIW